MLLTVATLVLQDLHVDLSALPRRVSQRMIQRFTLLHTTSVVQIEQLVRRVCV